MKHFNPRSPHGERLQGIFSRRSSSTISIHAPRTGSDCSTSSVPSSPIRFQSTLPARGATFVAVFRERGDLISIHAPRTGSDQSATRRAGAGAYFNPRSPHGERRKCPSGFRAPVHFNPRSPHGERRGLLAIRFTFFNISIHAPRTGSDPLAACAAVPIPAFQSTLPARGATWLTIPPLITTAYFNPRSPHGERQLYSRCPIHSQPISIHAPRTGSDARPCKATKYINRFQSTLPARGATRRNIIQ